MSKLLEWQVAEGSRKAHIIDASKPRNRRSGPRAECGKYPQRLRDVWFALSVDADGVERALDGYSCSLCVDCQRAVRER